MRVLTASRDGAQQVVENAGGAWATTLARSSTARPHARTAPASATSTATRSQVWRMATTATAAPREPSQERFAVPPPPQAATSPATPTAQTLAAGGCAWKFLASAALGHAPSRLARTRHRRRRRRHRRPRLVPTSALRLRPRRPRRAPHLRHPSPLPRLHLRPRLRARRRRPLRRALLPSPRCRHPLRQSRTPPEPSSASRRSTSAASR
jgi:hypothetical protein